MFRRKDKFVSIDGYDIDGRPHRHSQRARGHRPRRMQEPRRQLGRLRAVDGLARHDRRTGRTFGRGGRRSRSTACTGTVDSLETELPARRRTLFWAQRTIPASMVAKAFQARHGRGAGSKGRTACGPTKWTLGAILVADEALDASRLEGGVAEKAGKAPRRWPIDKAHTAVDKVKPVVSEAGSRRPAKSSTRAPSPPASRFPRRRPCSLTSRSEYDKARGPKPKDGSRALPDAPEGEDLPAATTKPGGSKSAGKAALRQAWRRQIRHGQIRRQEDVYFRRREEKGGARIRRHRQGRRDAHEEGRRHVLRFQGRVRQGPPRRQVARGRALKNEDDNKQHRHAKQATGSIEAVEGEGARKGAGRSGTSAGTQAGKGRHLQVRRPDRVLPRSWCLYACCIWPYLHELFEPGGLDRVMADVRNAGPIGFLILLGLQFLQIVVAFIPGEVVQIAAGVLYGPWVGAASHPCRLRDFQRLHFRAGAQAGCPVRAEHGAHELPREVPPVREDRTSSTSSVFVLFLIPGLPKDVFTYLVPLTDMNMRTFLLLSNIGRIPGIIVSTYAADGLMDGTHLSKAPSSSAVAAVIAILGDGVPRAHHEGAGALPQEEGLASLPLSLSLRKKDRPPYCRRIVRAGLHTAVASPSGG